MIYIVIKYDKIIMKMSKHQTVQIQTDPSDFKPKTFILPLFPPCFTLIWKPIPPLFHKFYPIEIPNLPY